MKIFRIKPYGEHQASPATVHIGTMTTAQQATLGKWVTGIVIACAALMMLMSGTTQIN